MTWYDANYKNYLPITIDHTKVSASDQSNFPVLISLTNINLKTASNGGLVQNLNGYDIIFVDSTDTTKLDHEIESYTASSGAIVMWVRVPTLSHTVDTAIHMYFNNVSISSSQENVHGVWDSNFKAVFHFGSSLTTDSTSNANAMTNNNVTATSGQIDGAGSFNGSNASIFSASGNFTLGTTDLTAEAWVYSSNFSQNGMILEQSTVNAVWEIFFEGGSLKLRGGSSSGISASVPSNSNWHHIVGTITGTTGTIYIDGVQVATGSVAAIPSTTSFLCIGSFDNAGYYFSGNIDEARVSNIVRSADWITTEYNNQSNPSTFYSIGALATIPSIIYTNVSTALFKFQVVKVYDSTGLFIDIVRDAPLIAGFKETISAAADAYKMILPRKIDAYDGLYQPGSKNTIVHGNIVQWWLYGAGLPTSGFLRYQGIIDTVTPQIDENGAEAVEVLVTPYSQLVLGDHGITSTVAFGTAGSSSTYIDTAVIFQSFFTGSYANSSGTLVSTIDPDTSKPYADPYTLDPASTTATGQKTQFAYQNQTNLSAFTTTLQLSPVNYFFRANQDKTLYFGPIPTSPTYTLILGQHITSIEYSVDNVPRKNIIVIQGKGVQGKYTGSSVSTVGKRVHYKSDNRVTDANTAQLIANGIGATLDQQQVRAKVKIPDYRGDLLPGLGYDIEKFKVGQTLKIVDGRAPATSVVGSGSLWGSAVWGRDTWGAPGAQQSLWGSAIWGSAIWGANVGAIFNTVTTIVAIQYDWFSVTLELGFRAPTLNRKIYALESQLQDSTLVS